MYAIHLIFLISSLSIALILPAQTDNTVKKDSVVSGFGETEEKMFNFTGIIYYLSANTVKLPDFKTLIPVGKIYTQKLNIPEQAFNKGFPGVTDRFEYFAIDYKGKFYIKESNVYSFMLGSDDGSKLFIDDTLVIDNDLPHALIYKTGNRQLRKGIHTIEVQYFQGPRMDVALILLFKKKVDKKFQLFDLTRFYPISVTDNGNSIEVSISDEILFEYNRFELNETALQALSEIGRILLADTKFKSIIVKGYTDDIGSTAYNLQLSQKRAKAVKNEFTKQGVDKNLIQTKGFGKANPKFPNTDEKNRKKNRRIEIEIIKN